MKSYDLLCLTETWNSKTTNIEINSYERFSCPRPKCNQKAKRESGGVIVYYRKTLSKGIEPVQQNGIFGVLSDVWSVCTI